MIINENSSFGKDCKLLYDFIGIVDTSKQKS